MKNYAKKALSMALALLMCFTVFALDWSGLRADAAGPTNPKHRFYVTAQQTSRESDSMDGQEGATGSCTVTMKNGNGSGSGQTTGSKSSLTVLVDSNSGSEVEVYNAYKNTAYEYFPVSVSLTLPMANNNNTLDGSQWVKVKCRVYVYNERTGSWVTNDWGEKEQSSSTSSSGDGQTNKTFSWSNVSTGRPAVSRVGINATDSNAESTYSNTLNETGGSNVTRSFNAYVYDQYGVEWPGNPSWSISNSTDFTANLSTTGASNSCTLTLGPTNQTHKQDTLTVTAAYSGATSKTFKVTVTPKYKISYNVSTNGGTSNTPSYSTVDNTTSSTSVSMTIPSSTLYTPTKSNDTVGTWTFVGWNASSSATTGTKAGNNITIDNYNKTLYAIFSKASTANFYWYDANGARQSSNQTKTIYNTTGSYSFSFPDIPNSFTLNGVTYTFAGWAQDSTSATTASKDNSNNSMAADNTSYTVKLKKDASYKFYALYTGSVKLSYDLNGGSKTGTLNAETKTLTLNCGANASAANNTSGRATFDINPDGAVITRTYSNQFLGWKTAKTVNGVDVENAEYTDGSTITIARNTTLYAAFHDFRYTVKFYDYDGTLKKTQSDIRHNYTATAPTMNTNNSLPDHQDANNHYVFSRWEYADGSEYKDSDRLTKLVDGYVYNVYAGYIGHSHLFGDPYDLVGEQTCYSGQTYKRKCSVCGYVREYENAQLDHQGEVSGAYEPTCTTPGTYGRMLCVNCGTELPYVIEIDGEEVTITDENRTIPALGHAWGVKDETSGEWTLVPTDPDTGALILKDAETGEFNVEPYTVPATCTASGYYYYVCANDELHVMRAGTIAPIDHTWVEHAEIPATCTTKGKTAYKECSVCGSFNATPRDIPALGHDLTHFEYTAPTCQADGNIEYYYCERCEKYFTDAAAATEIVDTDEQTIAEQIAIPMVDHSYETVTGQAPTCTEAGYTEASLCIYCHQVEPGTEPSGEVAALGHVWQREGFAGFETYAEIYGEDYVDEFVSDTPCTVASSVTYICPDCGEEYVVEDELDDHTPTHHEPVAATCTAAGNIEYWTCDVCGKYFSDEACTTEITAASVVIAKGEHSMTRFDGREADCENAGVAEYYYCSRCEKYYADENGRTQLETAIGDNDELIILSGTIPALGHNCTDWILSVAPSCGAAGKETCVCLRCDKVFTRDVAALEHTLTAVPAKAVSCTEAGNIAYWYCANCGKYYSDEEGANEIAYSDTVLEASGHSFDVDNPITDIPATCVADGKKVYACANCDAEVTVIILSTGEEHPAASIEDIEAVEPTCTELGWTAGSKCALCGEYLEKPVAVAKKDHVAAEDRVNVVAATCTADGYTGDIVCANCGMVLTPGTVDEKTGHVPGDLIEISAQTCVSKGVKVRYCTVEGCECSEAAGVPLNTYETPVLGHQIVNQRAVPATCTEAGLTAGSYCSRCGEVFEAQVTVDPLGHEMEAQSVVAPTCTALGYTVYVCANGCGKTYKDDYTDKVAHTEGTPATCTDAAVCSVCGRSYGAPLGHDFSIYRADLSTPSTCISHGAEVFQCSRCEATKSSELDFGEHNYTEDGAVITLPTCTTAGTVTVYCSVCGQSTTLEGDPALGHDYQNGSCTRCGAADPAGSGSESTSSDKCSKCGLNHNGRTGLWKEDGLFCRIIAFFRNLTKIFKK